jgi:uncharacterized protein
MVQKTSRIKKDQPLSRFDPFNDRKCRDIRNDLSKALAKALTDLNHINYESVARSYLKIEEDPVRRDYILNRQQNYQKILRQVVDEHILETIPRAILLWDYGLFFEFHELLEHDWIRAEGQYKIVLQALIRAAGVYVHLEQGNQKGAKRMAAKAIDSLILNRDAVPDIINLDLLLEKLRNRDTIPPLLGRISLTGTI